MRSPEPQFHYHPPHWLPEGHSQTIWSALYARCWHGRAPGFTRTRWDTPDGDFVDVDWLEAPAAQAATRPGALLVMFHGLEGSSASHYVQAFADYARSHGWAFAAPMFRGCSGHVNHAARAYHSGDWHEIDWLLQRLHDWKLQQLNRAAPLYAVGVSLGGNALLRWAQELGPAATQRVAALAAISAPLDLAACGHALHRGLSRLTYERMFLSTMKRKARLKWAQYPELFDLPLALQARSLQDFDDVFTGPLHGFASAADYWNKASARPHMRALRLPTLVLNALNDPFVPQHCLPLPDDVPTNVTLWQPAHGGHVGFAQGRWPGHVLGLPAAVGAWLQTHSSQEQQHG